MPTLKPKVKDYARVNTSYQNRTRLPHSFVGQTASTPYQNMSQRNQIAIRVPMNTMSSTLTSTDSQIAIGMRKTKRTALPKIDKRPKLIKVSVLSTGNSGLGTHKAVPGKDLIIFKIIADTQIFPPLIRLWPGEVLF